MSTKPLILFDIDKTLLNTDVLIAGLNNKLSQFLEQPVSEIVALEEAYSKSLPNDTLFDPQELLAILSRHFQKPAEKLSDVFYDPQSFQRALYPESIEVLSTLRNQNHPLGLFSQGNLQWQEHKILANNLMNFFDKRHQYIRENKKDPVIAENLPEGTIVIDDRSDVIAFLEQYPHLIPLHIVRGDHSPVGEYTLTTLHDVFPILKTLSQ